MSTEKDWVAEHDRLMTLLDQARAELMAYPGVIAVEIGVKQTGNDLTNDLAFRVYVVRKRAKQELTPEEIIPDKILGVKTDVIEQDIPRLTFDDDKYRPLKGGIQIANEESSTGTLGCIARRTSDNAIVVLSNSHVLMGGGVSVPSIEVGQPEIGCCCCCKTNQIGHVVRNKHDGVVDCAIAQLNAGIISENVIRRLNDDNTDGVLDGSTAAVVNPTDKVKKVGRTSDKTEGIIVSITHSTSANTTEGTPARTNQILIRPRPGFPLFQDRGDSGSVLVDKNNKVVGLMWGAYLTAGNALHGHGIACPIAPVLTEMEITIISGALTTALGYANVRVVATTIEEVPNNAYLMDYLQARLAQTSRGQLLLRLFREHRDEVLRLINHHRAVKVVWHRMQGPAFLAALGRSAKIKSYQIPAEIEGVSRRNALTSIINILEEHGSPALNATLDQYAPGLLSCLHLNTVAEMIDILESLPLNRAAKELLGVG
jgi:hypothetical protein